MDATPIHVKLHHRRLGSHHFTFSTFMITEIAMILLRSFSIFWTFYLTNYLDMVIMTSLYGAIPSTGSRN
jgi:hypothetical protein